MIKVSEDWFYKPINFVCEVVNEKMNIVSFNSTESDDYVIIFCRIRSIEKMFRCTTRRCIPCVRRYGFRFSTRLYMCSFRLLCMFHFSFGSCNMLKKNLTFWVDAESVCFFRWPNSKCTIFLVVGRDHGKPVEWERDRRADDSNSRPSHPNTNAASDW